MKVVEINGGTRGSTGAIMFGIAENVRMDGHEVVCFSPVTRNNADQTGLFEKMQSNTLRLVSVFLARATGLSGCFAFFSTLKTLKMIKKIKPDIIQIHTLHDSYINIPLLVRYIKKNKIKTVITLHDCWLFTGHCTHFDYEKCYRWKTQCCNCPKFKGYPKSFFDNSSIMHKFKKRWFAELGNTTIVTPSAWLASMAQQSFLGCYPIRVINNGVDLKLFRPIDSDIRYKLDIKNDEFLVLGVAFNWGEKKGLDVFIRLASILGKKYKIVLVGTNSEVDQLLPSNIISIHQTHSKEELAKIYSSADIFVNPTREEVLGLVNIEALACGTPVVTFDAGGSPECIDKNTGVVVPVDDIDSLQKSIIEICSKRKSMSEACVARAHEFDQAYVYNKYKELYSEIVGE